MRRLVFLCTLWLCVSGLALTACSPSDSKPPPRPDSPRLVTEATVRPLPVSGIMSADSMEISGLTWFRDTLVVLPQYPRRGVPKDQRRIFGIPRTALERALRDSTAAPLSPLTITLQADGLDTMIERYEGCEAIAFTQDRVFVLVEAKSDDEGMDALLVSGEVTPDMKTVRLNAVSPQSIPTQAPLRNMAYEALTVFRDTVTALYEVNGANNNAGSAAFQFSSSLAPIGATPFPTLEYRITDATETDEAGRFWVTNYFYPGERGVMNPAIDSLTARFGVGASHAGTDVVERLVEYQFTPDGIRQTGTPPIWLTLSDGSPPRNWEGIARFGDGFLVVTDQYPETILAYVDPPATSGLPDDIASSGKPATDR